MALPKLTENEIRIMIVPKHVRWPEPSTSMAWARLHHCVRALHLLAQSVDNHNLHLKAQYPFDGDALVRNRTELCAKTVEKLAQFAPLRAAERAVANELRELNQTSELRSSKHKGNARPSRAHPWDWRDHPTRAISGRFESVFCYGGGSNCCKSDSVFAISSGEDEAIVRKINGRAWG